LQVRDYVGRGSPIQLHKYFHHLNSSQAFALSLFHPYLTHARRALASALDMTPIEDWSFEEIPEPADGTNVDVSLVLDKGAHVYCEVKLSETCFGKAVNDERHRQKINRIYLPRLVGRVDPRLLEPGRFCSSYQILRNLWLAAADARTYVLFLLPKENECLSAELDLVLSSVSSELMTRVRVVHIEDLIAELATSTSAENELAWYAEMLREKYVPAAMASR
jgi:hypothetical protein